MEVRRSIRATLNGLDRRFGLRQWLWRGAEADEELRLASLGARDPFLTSPELQHPPPRTVIDVGGSHGQFAREIFRAFPGATIYSFEPIPECYEELRALSQTRAELRPLRLALSDEDGEREFFVSRFRDSSSLQPMLPAHTAAFPGTETETRIVVEAARLDAVAARLTLTPPVFAKLDVQGHELSVIRGGRQTLALCQRVMTECNFAPLYEGQPSFVELYAEMKALGFLFDGFVGHLRHPRTGELLSADAIFYRPAD
ncbi:MAG: FkbM family methyltransferase [Acidobacteria bacterium]|nr:FkbM family methyltransferase [Acidobacteriota bacterium]MCA1632218.1 FkbM family methyltransferase [Acidobacteriota bacterium]MCA1640398.1 FkbM family methyltransferase [Acidobacteriota bacterium]